MKDEFSLFKGKEGKAKMLTENVHFIVVMFCSRIACFIFNKGSARLSSAGERVSKANALNFYFYGFSLLSLL
jgi:hypothetical protein